MMRIVRFGGPLLAGIICLVAGGLAADLPQARQDAAASGNPDHAESPVHRYISLSKQLTNATAEKDYAKAIGICQEMAALKGVKDYGHANYNLARAFAHAGQTDDAFKALNLAIDQGCTNPERIKKDDNLASLRSDKRFDKALAKADRLDDPTGGKKLGRRLIGEFDRKDYQAAVETAGRILALTPKEVVTLYMLSCAQARLGHREESLAALTQAVKAGYSGAARMKADDDLASIRGDARFSSLLDKARQNHHAAFADSYRSGKTIAGVETIEGFPRDGLRYRLHMSPGATAVRPNRVVVWMHPSNSSSNDLSEPLAPMFIKHGYALLTFTQKSFRDWSDEDAAALAETLAEVGKIPGIDARKPILFGFSAGGQMALVMWELKPENYGGLVFGAAYPVLRTPAGYDVPHVQPLPNNPAVKNVPILALVGSADRNLLIWNNAEPAWRKAGIPYEVVLVPGKGHEWVFDQPRIERVAKWLDVAGGKLPASPSSPATAEQPTPSARPTQKGSVDESAKRQAAVDARKRLVELSRAMQVRNYTRARELLDTRLRLNNEDDDAWYDMACIESLTGHADKAIASLKHAFDSGYADFRHMERDADLDAIRTLPQYKDFLAHKDQIERTRAAKIERGLKESFGGDYLIETDDENRLVFATTIDRQTLDEVKEKLTAQAKALWNDLFDNRFEQYVAVIVLSEKDATRMLTNAHLGGGYDSGSHRLIARQIGYSLTHEFTHALHWADQEARGQVHPMWIQEGLATFTESSDIESGHLIPLPNPRLGPLQDAIRKNKMIPLRKFVEFDQRQYMQQPDLCYGEGRYIMMYLYSKGLLRKWYDAFVAGYKADPAGGKALEAVVGKPLDEIEKDFVAYIRALKPVPIRPTKVYLGLTTSMAPDGLRIAGVASGSGAFDAGLKAGDVITRVDGKRMVDRDRLMAYVSQLAAGVTVKVEFRRDGKSQIVPLTLKAVAPPR